MKLNKPHVFLYRTAPNSSDLKLVVLIPTKYEKAKQIAYNRNDLFFCIELKGAQLGSTQVLKYEFDVSELPHRKLTILTKLAQDEGFTVLHTAKASKPWTKSYISGYHLEVDDLRNPQNYTIHGLLSDCDGAFKINAPNNNDDGSNLASSASIADTPLANRWQPAKAGYSKNDIGTTQAVKIEISVSPAIVPEGDVILYHDDSDDKIRPFETSGE